MSAGNLCSEREFALGATLRFERMAPDGTPLSAETLSRITATNLH